jgi:hypothetical protein
VCISFPFSLQEVLVMFPLIDEARQWVILPFALFEVLWVTFLLIGVLQ